MKLLPFLLLLGCAHHAPLVWTEIGFQPYDHAPLPRQQAAYEESARKSMGISKSDWDAGKNRLAWEALHPKFAPRNSCHDTSLEQALSTP